MSYIIDSNQTDSTIMENESMELSEKLVPISDLNRVNRFALCKSSSMMRLEANDQIKLDTIFRSLVYVVEGSVTLYNGKVELSTIQAGTKEAQQPLSLDQTANQTIRTRLSAKLIRFGREQMEILLKEQEKAATHVIEQKVTEIDNTIFDEIVKDMGQNAISLCIFPETAQKLIKQLNISKQLTTKTIDIRTLERIIQSDPGLTAYIVFIASRSDNPTNEPITTIKDAILRLGLETSIKLAINLPSKHSLESNNPIIAEYLKKYKKRAIITSSLSQVLAKKTKSLNPNMALLAGLTADLGELLVITYAAKFEELFTTPKQLSETVETLHEIVGNWLLNGWGFAPEFVETTYLSRDWYRSNSNKLGYHHIVTAALLIIQSEYPCQESHSIPSSANLLITRHLLAEGIDLNNSKALLGEAADLLANFKNQLPKAS